MSATDSSLDRARRAARERAWEQAYVAFQQADVASLLPDDLESFADAAWWTSRLDESLAVRQRAYAAYAAAANDRRAGYTAWFLHADYLLFKGNASVASGWLQRAERHLASEPDSSERGFLTLTHADALVAEGDLPGAATLAEQALALGQSSRSEDLIAMALDTLGRVRIAQGDRAAGVALLDEAMCAVLAGALHPLFTGWIYCSVLSVCFRLADLKRAVDWSKAAASWCSSLGVTTPYHGLCRAYRVEVLTLLGELTVAESESRRAREELLALEPRLAGESAYAFGEIRRRLGDLAGAESAFRQAHELGRDPMPGLALVWLADGRAAEAATALAEAGGDGSPLTRARVLAARVEVAVATRGLEAARVAVDALEALAAGYPRSVVEATAHAAAGAFHLARGEFEPGRLRASQAFELWQELMMPYEAAAARMLQGQGAAGLGLADRARLDLEASRAGFEALGARRDAGRAADLLATAAPGQPTALSSRERQVLRLLADGRSNRQIAAELGLSAHTIARHVQNIFVKLGVSSRAAATAFGYEHGLL